MNAIQKLCRLCVKAGSSRLVSIFTEAVPNHQYSKLLFDLMNLRISENDSLPKYICVACAQDLLHFYQFKRRCESSECTLNTMVLSALKDGHQPFSPLGSALIDLSLNSHPHGEQELDNDTVVSSSFQIELLQDIPLQCNQCSQTFTRKSSLQQHLAVHEHGKQFECEICLKKFTRKSHVKIHMRRHTNLRPYTCGICSSNFTKSSDLRRHERIHSTCRDFICEICGKTFKRSTDVRSHMNSHTGYKPFKCKQCPKEYSAHSSMMKHCRKNKHF